MPLDESMRHFKIVCCCSFVRYANSVFFGWPPNKGMQKKMLLENNIPFVTYTQAHMHACDVKEKWHDLYASATILDNSFARKEILFMCMFLPPVRSTQSLGLPCIPIPSRIFLKAMQTKDIQMETFVFIGR